MSNIIKIAEYDIEAFIDNELDKKTYHTVLNRLADDPQALKKYKSLFRQKLLLKRWWKSKQEH